MYQYKVKIEAHHKYTDSTVVLECSFYSMKLNPCNDMILSVFKAQYDWSGLEDMKIISLECMSHHAESNIFIVHKAYRKKILTFRW